MTSTVCGICGGSGAGKTTLTRLLVDRLGPERVSVLAFDAYYHDLSHLSPDERARRNYDHPDSLDHELFVEHLGALRAGAAIEVPVYDFATHTRTGETRRLDPRPVVLVDGILLFAFAGIRDLLDHRIFIDVPADIRLARRIRRDVVERGRRPDDVRRQFARTVAPMHDL
ncbi:MAG: uridine kinase, partial [Actinomyces sp.]